MPPANEPAAVRAADHAPAALALLAQVMAARTPQAAARALVALLVAEHGLARAALALADGPRLHMLAVTGMATPDPGHELVQALTGAMHEALEQGLTLVEPAEGAHEAIGLEHRALMQLLGGRLATIPLGDGEQALGAVTMHRVGDRPFDAGELQAIEHTLTLAVPALCHMHAAQAPLHQVARRRFAAWRERLHDVDHRRTRRWLAGGAAALAMLMLIPLPHQVGGRARLEGAQQRILSAPADGHVQAAHVRPGDAVKAGAVLVELVDKDLALQRERWISQQTQHENAYAAAVAKADRVQAALSQARLDEAAAQVALVDEQLARSRVAAPFDGLVVQGDLTQSIGAPVRQGDPLVTLAATGQPRVVVEIDEVDVARVQVGQRGQLRVSSLPWDGHAIVVDRIAPLAKAVDGRNVFELQARMAAEGADADALRPGLQGRARIDVGWSPPLWAWARPWIDRLRLAAWSIGA